MPPSPTAESHISAAYRKPLAGDVLSSEGEKRELSPISDPRAGEVWKSLLEELSQEINSPSLRVWFEGTVPTSFEDSTLRLQVPNDFALEYIEERFGEIMRRVLRERVGVDAEVELKCWQPSNE